jgi:hypothetical protein
MEELMEDLELPPLDPNDPTLLEEDPEAPAEQPPSKPRLLTMRLIAERCLDKAEREQLSAEESAERVIGLTHLRLDRLRIGSMDGLELCNGATHIHLQHNLLREIESLDFFNALQFLVLANNQLEALDGLAYATQELESQASRSQVGLLLTRLSLALHRHLATLQYLDVSFNRIADAPVAKLPPSLKALDLNDNPCCESADHRARLVAGLERLFMLDGVDVSPSERRGSAAGSAGETEDESEDESEYEAEDEAEGEAEAEAEDGADLVGLTQAALTSAYVAALHTAVHQRGMPSEVAAGLRQPSPSPKPNPNPEPIALSL